MPHLLALNPTCPTLAALRCVPAQLLEETDIGIATTSLWPATSLANVAHFHACHATDDVKFSHARLRAAVEPATLPLHEMALTRRILDGLTDPTTSADCTIASLAAEYARKAIKRADDTRLKGLASRASSHAPTHTAVPQHPAPPTGNDGRGNPDTKGAGRGNGKGANAPRLPYFRSSALGRDTRIPTDANGANVPSAYALCGKGLLPGTTGHQANACPADRNTQDNWVYAGIPAQ